MVLTRVNDLYKKHERWVPIVFFLLGFLFDTVMLRRIDELKVILQQAVYLLIAGILVGAELIEEEHEIQSPKIIHKFWKYREAFLGFFLGTLLNSYAIFYFKSASAFSSFFFIVLIVTLLTLNEFKKFGKSQTQVHVALLSLCLLSYVICLAPTVLGFMGTLPFLCAVAASMAIFSGYYVAIRAKLVTNPSLLKTHLFYPYFVVQVTFVILYFAHLIPPVPLSVKYMGIYHGAEKTGDAFTLTSAKPKWKFWQHGDQTFLARPGDVIYCYTQIFSPTRFKDQLQIRWLNWDEAKGWMPSDAMPIPVTGGREEGYRVVTTKTNYQAGIWRVRVETMDNQEIGRIDFEVIPDDSVGERNLQQEVRS
jgi:hypothetical protein